MRAAQGAAAPVTKPKKEPGVDARPVLALSVQLSAAMNPRTGGRRGHSPGPFFPTAFFWKESGAPAGQAPPGGLASIERATTGRPYIVGPSCGSFASARESSFPPLGLLLPTPTTSLGRRGGPIGCAGSYPTDGAPAAQASGNPSSAPVCALGHLPPSGGKAPGAPVSGQKSAPPGIRAALVFTALRGNTPNQGWQAAACRGCCAGR